MRHQTDFTDRLKPLVFWLGIALIIRLLYLFEQGSVNPLFFQPILDEKESIKSAQELLMHGGFGEVPFFKAPLHSLWIGLHLQLFGDGFYYTVRLAQHFLGALLVPISFLAAAKLVTPGKARTIASHSAAFLLAIHAPLIRLEDRLVLDFLVVFFQSVMLWALIMAYDCSPKVRWKWYLAAGIIAALAWLTRPTITIVLPFIPLWVLGVTLLKRKHLKQRLLWAGAFTAPVLMAVFGIGLRNATTGGEFMILPWQGGYNLYYANNETATGRYFLQSETVIDNVSGNPTMVLMTQGYLKENGLSEIDSYANLDSWWKEKSIEMIKADPARWLGLMLRKTLFLTSDREIFNFENYDLHRSNSTILSLLPGRFGFIWPLAFASFAFLAITSRGRRRKCGIVILYGILLGAGIALYYTSGRMRMPIVFPAILLASFGLGTLTELITANSKRVITVLYSGLFVAGIFMSWHDIDDVRTENFDHVELATWSNASWRSGHYEKALEYAQQVEKLRPEYSTIPQLKAQAHYSLGDFDEAEKHFQLSLERIPEDPNTFFNLALVQYEELGKKEEALSNAMQAYENYPQKEKVEWLLARLYYALGRADEGAQRLRASSTEPLTTQTPLALLLALAARECQQGNAPNSEMITTIIKDGYGDYGLAELGAELNRQECGIK